MNLLALETTEKTGSLAAFDGPRLLRFARLDPHQRSAQSLAVGLNELLSAVGWKAGDVRLVAVAIGPGSFTGLRVGVTAAKTLAYAVGAEVIGVNTLEAIAARAPEQAAPLWAVMDAQREQVYAARFVRSEGKLQTDRPTEIVDAEAWLAQLEPGDVVSGPVLGRLAPRLPANVIVLPQDVWAPTAEQVGRLALNQYEAGRRDDLWQLVPQYYRKSAAEEKFDARAQRPA